ncbi:MAG: sugar ABC transporter permease [Sphaerochaetaceae bacterium]|nr:sugar ABC transporter permease [Sphaerochaetaceae bacterium]
MRSKSENGFNWLALLFVSPVIIFLTVFTFYPFVRSIVMTFFVTDSLGNPGMFVGLRIWKKVLSSSEFKVSLGTTFKYSLAKGVLTFCLAMLMAFLCTKKTKRSKVYQTMFALPIAIASAPICAIVTYVFCRYGVFNAITGRTEAWLALSKARFWIIVLSSVWSSSGSSFIYLLVGFRNVPDELIECANLDGCGPVRRFFQIFIPIASPQIFFVIFLNILSAFKGFAIIKILVGNVEAPEVTTLILKLYQYAFVRDRYEIACVYGLILAVVIFVVSRIQFMVEKKVVFYQ